MVRNHLTNKKLAVNDMGRRRGEDGRCLGKQHLSAETSAKRQEDRSCSFRCQRLAQPRHPPSIHKKLPKTSEDVHTYLPNGNLNRIRWN
uniref:Uncharacterized protein n=1 Tax=Onchocerca volvulus TaxID=6282 RepID=A0A8R1XQ98_ONCVO